MAIVKIDNVSFTYPNEAIPILKNINLTIQQGEFIVLIVPIWLWEKYIASPFQTRIAPTWHGDG